ncbi:hypothetical protein [Sphingobacterium gobiense]|uniref:YD repeat-containing protein n=1 Tax=Sphingobacterium gobiense TaxID=1382456 RepID=A0A2S9JUX3_9SPHI|nr:hypothetical protein [Sphingobacterium gobiense]PRD57086.1 hypothetical protein C5749_07735 [Sphingobacterium gobiense]
MKKADFSLLILAVSLVGLNACRTWKDISTDNTTAYFQFRGKPEKVILYRYQQDGELFDRTIFLFNQNGQLTYKYIKLQQPKTKIKDFTSQWIYDKNGFLLIKLKDNKKETFVNDRYGRVKKSYFYQHPDSLPQLTKVKYKPKKRMRISKVYLADGTYYSKGISKYDGHGHIVYSQFSIPGYDSIEETWWERDADGNTTRSKMISNEHTDTVYVYSSYDPNGNVIKERYVDEAQKEWIKDYAYRFDKVGNWIERTIDEDGYVRTEQRKITYYD